MSRVQAWQIINGEGAAADAGGHAATAAAAAAGGDGGGDGDAGAAEVDATVLSRMQQVLVDYGIELADVPRAIVMHEVLGFSLYFGAWALCYQVQLTKNVARPLVRAFPSLEQRAGPKAIKAAVESAGAAISRRGWLTKVPVLRSADPARLVLALGESFVARNMLRPATIPAKLWITFAAITAWKQARDASTKD